MCCLYLQVAKTQNAQWDEADRRSRTAHTTREDRRRRCGKRGDARVRCQAQRKNLRPLPPEHHQSYFETGNISDGTAIKRGIPRSRREKTNVDDYSAIPTLPGDSEEESRDEPGSSGSYGEAEVGDAEASTDGEGDHEDMQDEGEDLEERDMHEEEEYLEEGEVISIESIDGGDEGEEEDAEAPSGGEDGDEDMQDEGDDSWEDEEHLEDGDQDTAEEINERPTQRTKLFMTKNTKLRQARQENGMGKKEHFAKGFEKLPGLDRVLTALLLPEVESGPSTKRLFALKKLLDGINENDMAAAPHAPRPDNGDDLLRLPKVREVIGRVYEKSSDERRHIVFRALDLGTDVTGLTPSIVKLKNVDKLKIRNWGHTTATLEAALPELIRLLERMPDEYWNKASSFYEHTTSPLLLQIAINRMAPPTTLIIRRKYKSCRRAHYISRTLKHYRATTQSTKMLSSTWPPEMTLAQSARHISEIATICCAASQYGSVLSSMCLLETIMAQTVGKTSSMATKVTARWQHIEAAIKKHHTTEKRLTKSLEDCLQQHPYLKRSSNDDQRKIAEILQALHDDKFRCKLGIVESIDGARLLQLVRAIMRYRGRAHFNPSKSP